MNQKGNHFCWTEFPMFVKTHTELSESMSVKWGGGETDQVGRGLSPQCLPGMTCYWPQTRRVRSSNAGLYLSRESRGLLTAGLLLFTWPLLLSCTGAPPSVWDIRLQMRSAVSKGATTRGRRPAACRKSKPEKAGGKTVSSHRKGGALES